MTSIGLHRLLARCGMILIVDGLRWRNPTIGRQGKSAASGRAQVVGWVESFRRSDTQRGWRFTAKHERFQGPKRHPAPLEPLSLP